MPNLIKRKVFSSVQTKVILTTILMITAILACFAIYNYFNERNEKLAELQVSAEVSASRLAATLATPLWDLDKALISDTLESEMLDQNILALILRDSDGEKIFSAKQRNNTWQIVSLESSSGLDEVTNRKTAFNHKREIIYGDNKKIGDIEVYVSSRFVDEKLKETLISIIVTVLILDLTIFLVLFVLLRVVIIKPIVQLSELLERMSHGELNIELDTARHDEIGLMANAIERLQASLRIAMSRLNRNA